MDAELTDSDLASMAAKEFQDVLDILPSDDLNRMALLIETLRVLDYWMFHQSSLPEAHEMSAWRLDIVRSGWNKLAANLLISLSGSGVPMQRSTAETRNAALTLLHGVGKAVFLKRCSDMMRYGLLSTSKHGDMWIVKRSGESTGILADSQDFFHWGELQERLAALAPGTEDSGWTLFETDDVESVRNVVGRHMGRATKQPWDEFVHPDITSLLRPLLRSWDSGYGIMIAYDAAPEVDAHYLAIAAKLVTAWAEDAGLHPDAQFGMISGLHLRAVVLVVVSLHLKHIGFCGVATEREEILIPQSLTLWQLKVELEETLCGLSGLALPVVKQVLEIITLRATDVSDLSRSNFPYVPLLVDLGNEFLVRPISALTRNPFLGISLMQGWRSPHARNARAAPREEWLRKHLYAQFQGTRYICVNGNIKVRREKKIITDIDAAILDRTTGELALFQIKWQDYATDDVQELRSRASNLTKEMDDWAEKVMRWILEQSVAQLSKSLRLPLRADTLASSIYLFGISRNVFRTGGLGFESKHNALAICNWPLFCRARHEVGPAPSVFGALHKLLFDRTSELIKLKPVPFELIVGDRTILFQDLWNTVDETEASDHLAATTTASG